MSVIPSGIKASVAQFMAYVHGSVNEISKVMLLNYCRQLIWHITIILILGLEELRIISNQSFTFTKDRSYLPRSFVLVIPPQRLIVNLTFESFAVGLAKKVQF